MSLVSTPLILILAFWVLARSLQEVGGFAGLANVRPTTSMALAVTVTAVVGTVARQARRRRTGPVSPSGARTPVWACVIGFLVRQLPDDLLQLPSVP